MNPTILDNDLEHSEPKEIIVEPKEEIEKIPEVKQIPVQVVKKKVKISFWTEDPNVLFQPNYVLEFFPVDNMSFNQKLNALTRLVIIMTLVAFVFTGKERVLVVSAISLLCIFFLHYSTKQNEGFYEGDPSYEKAYSRHGPLIDIHTNENQYQESDPSNPLSNVLLNDYDYNPQKKPAPPSFTKEDRETILDETKKQVQLLNPGQPNIDKKLFHSATDNLELEQSMRQFYSTANTTIPNDQAGFAEFCYGDMISAKEGNMFASVRNNPRYNLY
jgi:hypothetical protein